MIIPEIHADAGRIDEVRKPVESIRDQVPLTRREERVGSAWWCG